MRFFAGRSPASRRDKQKSERLITVLIFQKGETSKRSGRLGSAGWANIGAGTAVLALGSVNHEQAVHLRDCAFRAFSFACTALNAIIGNYIRHGCFPFFDCEIRYFQW
jgi:hypothetical protein